MIVLGIALALAATGCGMTEKRAHAELLADAFDHAVETGAARIVLTQRIELRHERLLDQLAAQAAQDEAPRERVQEASLEGVARFDQGRVGFRLPAELGGAAGGEAALIFNGTSIFQRRLDVLQIATTDGSGEGSDSTGTRSPGRAWVRLDLRQLDPDDIDNRVSSTEAAQRSEAAQAALNPNFLLQLLKGTLSGSVTRVGVDEVRGEKVTHYDFNVDREKATDDDPEEIQDTFEAVFKSLFVDALVVPAQAWIDDDGLPRRFEVTFEQKLGRQPLADLTISFEIFDYGAAVDVALPPPGDTVRVSGIEALAAAVRGS